MFFFYFLTKPHMILFHIPHENVKCIFNRNRHDCYYGQHNDLLR